MRSLVVELGLRGARPSVVEAHVLSSCGAWTPEHAGSVAAVHGLRCSEDVGS